MYITIYIRDPTAEYKVQRNRHPDPQENKTKVFLPRVARSWKGNHH